MENRSRSTLITLLLAAVAGGAGVTYLVVSRSTATDPSAVQGDPLDMASAGDAFITLTPEAMARSNIKTASVVNALVESETRVPATVEPSAAQQIVVSARVSGRISRLVKTLGQEVQSGDLLAEMYSPELADAERAFVTARTELQAQDRKVEQLKRLVDIGATARQELERAQMQQSLLATALTGARGRLDLMGLSDDQITTLSPAAEMTLTTEVRAPADGFVTVQAVDIDTNVQAGTSLFTIANLSTVWVVGDLPEAGLPQVHTGDAVTISSPELPDLNVRGTVSYIDAEAARGTRIAKVRAEVANQGLLLRPGVAVQLVILAAAGAEVPVVPRTAIQTISDRSVVYVPDPGAANRFQERVVRTGRDVGDNIEIVSGLSPGERFVSEGSLAIRTSGDR